MLIGSAIMAISVVFVLVVLPSRIRRLKPEGEAEAELLEMGAVPAIGD